MRYTYSVKKQRRKTKGVYVVGLDRVEFRVPTRTGEQELVAFIRDSEPWVVAHLSEYRRRIAPYLDVACGKAVLLDGKKLAVAYGERTRLDSAQGVLYVPDRNALLRFLRERAKGVLPALVEELSRVVGVSCAAVKITSARTKWGYCTAKGVLGLNYRLVCVPEALRRYVVVHELCHRLHLDHSPAFWRTVARFCPDCKTLRKALSDQYGFLLTE